MKEIAAEFGVAATTAIWLSGARRDRRNINRRVLAPAVRAASAVRAERREPPLPGSITAHTFRRTFITLMLEAGAPVSYVQA